MTDIAPIRPLASQPAARPALLIEDGREISGRLLRGPLANLET
jgi:hypothetical protein